MGEKSGDLGGFFKRLTRLSGIIHGSKSGSSTKAFQPGQALVEEGKAGKALYLISRGQVEIRKAVATGGHRVIGVRGEGDAIGEMALVDDEPHSASAIATEETETMVMSREEFNRHLDEMDPFMREIVCLLVRRGRLMADMLAEDVETSDP